MSPAYDNKKVIKLSMSVFCLVISGGSVEWRNEKSLVSLFVTSSISEPDWTLGALRKSLPCNKTLFAIKFSLEIDFIDKSEIISLNP